MEKRYAKKGSMAMSVLTTIQPSSMGNFDDIKQDLQGFINHGDQLFQEDLTGKHRRQDKPLSYY